MVGNSCDSVCVRSTTRILPLATACANARRSMSGIDKFLVADLALERLGIDGEPLTHVLGDVADEYVFKSALERFDHGLRKRGWRHLRRRHGLEPFGFERAEEDVEHLDAAGTQLRTQA